MPYTIHSPLIGTPQASISQCAAYLSRTQRTGYSAYDIRNVILLAYFKQAGVLGLDPILAIAQMCHETGALTSWWSERPRRNPAGLGVTGRTRTTDPKSPAWALKDGKWHEGLSFASWEAESIPAHLGRLLAYALPDAQATDRQRRAIDQALALRSLPAAYRGAAPTLAGLAGRWAVPGTTYPAKIAAIAEAIRSLE